MTITGKFHVVYYTYKKSYSALPYLYNLHGLSQNQGPSSAVLDCLARLPNEVVGQMVFLSKIR